MSRIIDGLARAFSVMTNKELDRLATAVLGEGKGVLCGPRNYLDYHQASTGYG